MTGLLPYLLAGAAVVGAFLLGTAWAGPRAYSNGVRQGRRDIVDNVAAARRLEATPLFDEIARRRAMAAHPAGRAVGRRAP